MAFQKKSFSIHKECYLAEWNGMGDDNDDADADNNEEHLFIWFKKSLLIIWELCERISKIEILFMEYFKLIQAWALIIQN